MNGKPNVLKEAFEEAVYHCGRCALCHPVCIVYQDLKHEGLSPRGRVQLSKALLEGEVSPSSALFERLQTCLDCKQCLEACPSGVEVDNIILAARGEVARFLPLTIRMAVYMLASPEWMAELGLPFASKVFDLLKLSDPSSLLRRLAFFIPPRYIPRMTPRPFQAEVPEFSLPSSNPKGRVVLFAGCFFSKFMPHIARAAHHVLLRAGYEVIVPRDTRCCGAPPEHMGLHDLVDKLMEHNVKVFMRYRPDIVSTPCASGGLTLKRHLEGAPFEVLDLSELLLRNGWEEPRGELPLRVTYHDPCHLNRGQGIRNEPREILRSVPGVDLVEMKEPERCCGGAGLFFALFPKLSTELGLFKVEAIKETEVEVLTTWCPSCMMQLEDMVRRTGLGISVRHVLEVVGGSYSVMDGISEPQEAGEKIKSGGKL